MPLFLASGSSIRRQMLEAAGVPFSVAPPKLDEEAIKKAFNGNDAALAATLAEAKALAGPLLADAGDWAIGSDSVLSVDNKRFSKPRSKEDAADHLRFFSGKQMLLTSAVALARAGKIDWSCADTARLKVRELSDAFITEYLDREWPDVGYTVGVFRMEGPGVQLFDAVEGDYYTILGMPLLPLLGALRERGLILS